MNTMPDITGETTNAVLKGEILALKELSDVKFGNIEKTLTRIELSNAAYATVVQLEEMKKDFNKSLKEFYDNFSDHTKNDKESFIGLSKQMSFLTKTAFIAMGGASVLLFFIQYGLPIIFHK